ncbi:CheR family methyltransferase [Kaarinaea lacus]
MTVEPIAEQDYQIFRDYMKNASGIVLGDNKKFLVMNRLGHLMDRSGTTSVDSLLEQMKSKESLRQQVMDAMTTTDREWFRDGYPFEMLKEKILPEIATTQPQEVRIWSAGCSTGQEPYSISMAVQEYLEHKPGALPPRAVQIVGTELSPKLLNIAESGIYEHVDPADGINKARKERFFSQVGNSWKISDDIRSRVSFRQCDLKKNYTALGLFDIIYCRNVLIYFSSDMKKDMLSRMARLLKPRGYLVLGASESITGYSDDFDSSRWRDGVVYRLRN